MPDAAPVRSWPPRRDRGVHEHLDGTAASSAGRRYLSQAVTTHCAGGRPRQRQLGGEGIITAPASFLFLAALATAPSARRDATQGGGGSFPLAPTRAWSSPANRTRRRVPCSFGAGAQAPPAGPAVSGLRAAMIVAVGPLRPSRSSGLVVAMVGALDRERGSPESG